MSLKKKILTIAGFVVAKILSLILFFAVSFCICFFVVTAVCTLGPNITATIAESFGPYDEDWIEGKTMAEITEKYGDFDLYKGDCAYYLISGKTDPYADVFVISFSEPLQTASDNVVAESAEVQILYDEIRDLYDWSKKTDLIE